MSSTDSMNLHMRHVLKNHNFKDLYCCNTKKKEQKWQAGPQNPSFGVTPTIDFYSPAFTNKIVMRPRQFFYWYDNDKDL